MVYATKLITALATVGLLFVGAVLLQTNIGHWLDRAHAPAEASVLFDETIKYVPLLHFFLLGILLAFHWHRKPAETCVWGAGIVGILTWGVSFGYGWGVASYFFVAATLFIRMGSLTVITTNILLRPYFIEKSPR